MSPERGKGGGKAVSVFLLSPSHEPAIDRLKGEERNAEPCADAGAEEGKELDERHNGLVMCLLERLL